MSEVNKRRRTTSIDSLCINDLPDIVLAHVAIFLAKPSQALFAITLMHQSSAKNSSTPNTKSNAIISATSSWRILDFGDIEKSLAAMLTDHDVHAILSCIDAPNNVKRLKLAGCVKITGRCLDIMRNSALEHIDLSLAGKCDSPSIDPLPQLSELFVIPFLDDIMGRGSLKLLELPKKFRDERTNAMRQFLVRYNEYIRAFRYTCSMCNELCEEDHHGWVNNTDQCWGMQNFTCCSCLSFSCYRDNCVDEDETKHIHWCDDCEKEYCRSCVPWTYCFQCDKDDCRRLVCAGCIEIKGEGGKCDTCSKEYCCSECQYFECSKDWENACSTCAGATATTFHSHYYLRRKSEISPWAHLLVYLQRVPKPKRK